MFMMGDDFESFDFLINLEWVGFVFWCLILLMKIWVWIYDLEGILIFDFCYFYFSV